MTPTDPATPLRTFSYGGGVQSTAALVLAAERRIDFDVFLFCNVGDDSENPLTLQYVREVAIPYAEAHSIALHELQRRRKDGTPETLYGRLVRPDSRSMNIPVYMSTGAPAKRACTVDFKIAVIARWQKQHGATRDNPATCGLGISVDEAHRAKTASGIPHQTLTYPLLDLRLTRADCRAIITEAGLPVPPKSSCFFCPYHSMTAWEALRREQPDCFAQSVALEAEINRKREAHGLNRVFLTAKCVPLDAAVPVGQATFDFDDLGMCESGYCMT